MSLHRYSESSNHVMVFCEALYLNTLVSVSTFSESNHYKYYIYAGWRNYTLHNQFFINQINLTFFFVLSWPIGLDCAICDYYGFVCQSKFVRIIYLGYNCSYYSLLINI